LLDSLLQEITTMPETMNTKDADYEFFKPGVDGRKEGQKPTDKRFAMVGGLLGLGGVAYMAREFKNRPQNMKLSVYLIHTRLIAQGTVIGGWRNVYKSVS